MTIDSLEELIELRAYFKEWPFGYGQEMTDTNLSNYGFTEEAINKLINPLYITLKELAPNKVQKLRDKDLTYLCAVFLYHLRLEGAKIE